MQNLRFLSKARLCLCFVVNIVLAGCSSFKSVSAANQSLTEVWKIEVEYIPGVVHNWTTWGDLSTPLNFFENGDVIIAVYSFNGENEIIAFKNMLLATGEVAAVNCTLLKK
jgi:uncharacterized protein YceK